MKNIKFLFFVFIISSLTKIQAQCNLVETINICDMTIIDVDSDGNEDGIINLFDRYNGLPGVTPIDASMGTWFDPNYNFALDGAGNLHLWDLDTSSQAEPDHQFHFLSTASGCPDDILIRLNVVVGPFSGNAFPPNANNVNIQICDLDSTPTDGCGLSRQVDIDLFQTLEFFPSPHLNGRWEYNGSSPNFVSLTESDLIVTIPYAPGPPLDDEETFEFSYIVEGLAPCNLIDITTVNVSVVRNVFSGYAKNKRICENDIKNGNYDADLNLRDDEFLAQEDIEGTWTGDAFGQIDNSLDPIINIKNIYDQIVAGGVKFGCVQVDYTYSVEQRSGVCSDTTSTVSFKIYEYIRPFEEKDSLPPYCENDDGVPTIINLYDRLEFKTENGILFDYNRNAWTNWTHVSGPSNLGLVSSTSLESPQPEYSSLGTINLLNAPPGDYVFEYTVYPQYNCWPDTFEVVNYTSDYCSTTDDLTLCGEQSAQIRFTIHSKLYAGEDTEGKKYCETDPLIANPSGLDLIGLLDTNGVDSIHRGPEGVWIDSNTNSLIPNPFIVPQINDQQTFEFEYITTTVNGCEDRATLSFTVFEEYQSGTGLPVKDVCDDNAPFDLFDDLSGNPNTNGTWEGPNGYTSATHNAIFTPGISDEGDYIYTAPDNVDAFGVVLCTGNSATITVVNHQRPSAGTGVDSFVCRSDLQIDLEDYLDSSADSGGVFRDMATGDLLTGSLLDVSQLAVGTFNYQYEIQGHASCLPDTSQISITVVDVPTPTAADQIFCANTGPRVLDLVATNGTSFNWYDNIDDTTSLPIGTVLINGEDYFVASVDSEGCESPRIGITVEVLPLNHSDCDSCFKDGVSVNGDGENDEFDLCGLTIIFPNFDLSIFNRYGSTVYKGNKNTSLFKGLSNVPLTFGDELPSGVYFYIFDPKDGSTAPTQGNFYLSR